MNKAKTSPFIKILKITGLLSLTITAAFFFFYSLKPPFNLNYLIISLAVLILVGISLFLCQKALAFLDISLPYPKGDSFLMKIYATNILLLLIFWSLFNLYYPHLPPSISLYYSIESAPLTGSPNQLLFYLKIALAVTILNFIISLIINQTNKFCSYLISFSTTIILLALMVVFVLNTTLFINIF